MKVGELVFDYALEKNGIVVGGPWKDRHFHPAVSEGKTAPFVLISWDWLVMYDDGELMGADTMDLQVLENEV